MQALGFVETMGLIGAIEAADAMLKAANVRLLEKSLSSGGLVCISVAGEVAAVKASVDAAVAAVQRIPGARVHSQHVIARPDTELSGIIRTQPMPEADDEAELAETVEVIEMLASQAAPQARYSAAQLKKMDIMRLKKIIQEMGGCCLCEEEMAKASRKDLVQAILNPSRL